MHTLFAEKTCFSLHPVILSLVEAGGASLATSSSTSPFRASSLGRKTEFVFKGKLVVQNTFDSRHKEEFVRIELVHKANEGHVDLLVQKQRFSLDKSQAFEFQGDIDIYLLKATESSIDESSIPPRKMSMNHNRANIEEPKRPSISVYQNVFPLDDMLECIRENIAYLQPEPRLQDLAKGDLPNVQLQIKIVIQIQYRYTTFDLNQGLEYLNRRRHLKSALSSTSAETAEVGSSGVRSGSSSRASGSGSSSVHSDIQETSRLAPLAQCLKNLLVYGIHADVQLQVDEAIFPAHMAILAAQSEVFQVMFDSNMVERKTKRVVIRDMSAAAVKEMLNFIYTRETKRFRKNIDMAIEMLHASEKYLIADLRKASEAALENMDLARLAIDEILGLYMCSRQLNMPRVQRNSLKGLLSKGSALAPSKAFQHFCREHPQIIPEFFAEFSGLQKEAKEMQSIEDNLNQLHT